MKGGVFVSAKRKYRRILVGLLIVSTIFTCFFSYRIIDEMIPNQISVIEGTDASLKSNLLVQYTVKEEMQAVDSKTSKDNVNQEETTIRNYTIQADLLGLIHFKDVEVNVIQNQKLIPCGIQVGIYLQTKGVMIIGTSSVNGIDGMKHEPANNIARPDDYIVSLNGIAVSSKSQLIFLVNKYGNQDIVLGIKRNGNYLEVKITPIQTAEEEYKLGIWVRDDTQGIGTLTYITEDGYFGALGHGISDVDTGALLSSENGTLYNADIWGIKKGESGNPGGLLGSIEYEADNVIGKIADNNSHGIFGTADKKLIEECKYPALPIGLKQEVVSGPAKILCALQGEVEEYEIEIVSVDYANNEKSKGMVIQITDPKLLSKTNGIVQGMSGSPIIQNGKLIGAVTHVFVKEPTKGYGIFIESMLSETKH